MWITLYRGGALKKKFRRKQFHGMPCLRAFLSATKKNHFYYTPLMGLTGIDLWLNLAFSIKKNEA